MKNETYHERGEHIDGHPVREHTLYYVWAKMKSRCSNPSEPTYVNYGGRGISYCERWKHFANFVEDMGPRPSPQHTIERVDNNGDYCKENCVWATRTEQCLNRRLFTNNKTGYTGVQEKGGRYLAKFNLNGVRYQHSGSFATAEEAYAAYLELRLAALEGRDVSAMVERQARFDNKTGVRGISKREDGYIVRVTNSEGKRIYLGFDKDFDDAVMRLEKWKQENK